MDKQELIQLHALGVVLRSHLEDRHESPVGAFRPYDRHGVAPVDIYRRKDAHEEALFHVLDGLVTAIEASSGRPERVPSRPETDG